jgi:hypothetical protein
MSVTKKGEPIASVMPPKKPIERSPSCQSERRFWAFVFCRHPGLDPGSRVFEA